MLKFKDQPFPKVSTYIALGLSRFELPMNDGRKVRTEFLFSAYDHFDEEQIASFLMSFAEYASEARALLRGQVVGLGKPLKGTSLSFVYVAIPVFFSDSFHAYAQTTPETIFIWLMPLYEEEAIFIRKNGWNKFEDLLMDGQYDFWDLNRKPFDFVGR